MTPGWATPRNAAHKPTSLWSLGVACAGAALFVLSPNAMRYPAVLLSVFVFAACTAVFPAARPRRHPAICPLNWTLVVFLLQLVVAPLLMCVFGPYKFTLPVVPADADINAALLISAGAFAAFAAGTQLADRHDARPTSWLRLDAGFGPPTAGVFAILGVVGLLLAFHSFGALVAYFGKPAGNVGLAFAPRAGSVSDNAAAVLRPFLGFACVLLWCWWLDRQGERSPRWKIRLFTVGAALAILVAYGTFGYNRGAVAAPLVALSAVYVLRVRSIKPLTVVVVGVAALIVLAGIRTYRNTDLTLTEALQQANGRTVLIQNTSLNDEVQVYGGAPQFLAFLLQRSGYSAHLDYGKTLVSSVMSPVPVLGKTFRPTSGPTIYNQLIYGRPGILDQIVPFQGELHLSFGVPGVLFGYLVFGWLIGSIQTRFVQARSALEAFIVQYAGTWLAFLVSGSIAVVSQIFIFVFWPIYVVLAMAAVRGRRSRDQSTARA